MQSLQAELIVSTDSLTVLFYWKCTGANSPVCLKYSVSGFLGDKGLELCKFEHPTGQCASEEMEFKPVTLVVKIYERAYNVRYPSEQRVIDLMREFATHCKGVVKPGCGRRFFVCIHCGKSDFSNKLMLNVHRFEQGCPGAVYEDGTKALLLPYPDFLPGQGKMVEVMGKHGGGKTVGSKTLKGATGGEAGGDAGGVEDVGVEDEEWDEEFQGPPPLRRQSISVTDAEAYGPGNVLTPAADLFYGAAPPRSHKAPSRPRRLKRNADATEDAEAERGGKVENATAPKKMKQAGGTGRGLMKVLAGTSTDHAATEAAQTVAQGKAKAERDDRGKRLERHAAENLDNAQDKKKRRTDRLSALPEFRGSGSEQPPPLQEAQCQAQPPVSWRPQSRHGIQTEIPRSDDKGDQIFHVKAGGVI